MMIDALIATRMSGCEELALLHCAIGHPARVKENNLKTLAESAEHIKVPVGLSDHKLDTVVSVAATALRTCRIGKHFTLRREDGSPDAAFSLEPHRITWLVTETREAWRALGQANYEGMAREAETVVIRGTLYAVRDIEVGEMPHRQRDSAQPVSARRRIRRS